MKKLFDNLYRVIIIKLLPQLAFLRVNFPDGSGFTVKSSYPYFFSPNFINNENV